MLPFRVVRSPVWWRLALQLHVPVLNWRKEPAVQFAETQECPLIPLRNAKQSTALEPWTGNFSGKGSQALLACSHTPGPEITDLKQISSFNPSTYWSSCLFSFSNIPWSNAKLKSIKKIGIPLLWEIFLIVVYQFYILYMEIKRISCNIF